MENKISNERTERIMGSLEGIHKTGAPDFFYTRLKGKMQQEERGKPFFMLRPAFITAALSILLIVNVISLFEINRSSEQHSGARSNSPATIETFAKAYNMNAESVFE